LKSTYITYIAQDFYAAFRVTKEEEEEEEEEENKSKRSRPEIYEVGI
jgi:hypothetical protein